MAKNIAIDNGKRRVIQQHQGIGNAACGFKCTGLGRILNTCAKLFAITKCSLNLYTEMGVVDYDVTNACAHQFFNMPDNQGFPADNQQRFGCVISERPHTLASPSSQQHGFHFVAPEFFCMSCSASVSSKFSNGLRSM